MQSTNASSCDRGKQGPIGARYPSEYVGTIVKRREATQEVADLRDNYYILRWDFVHDCSPDSSAAVVANEGSR